MEEQKSCQFEDCDVKTWRSKLTLIISIFSLFFLYINSGGAGKKKKYHIIPSLPLSEKYTYF